MALLCAGIFSAAAAPIHQADAEERESPQASVRPIASVSVLRCRSNAYYAAREISFRAMMMRVDPGVSQALEVKAELWRKLNEAKRYRRLKLPGIGAPTTGRDPSATAYAREIIVTSVEPASRYRLRARFSWRDPSTGRLQQRKTVWSKPCRQRTSLPRLRIVAQSSVAQAGSKDMRHSITVANKGGSEAVNVPVAIRVDGAPPIVATIDSIGPRQSADVSIVAPACRYSADAVIDPLRALVRLGGAMRARIPLERCG